MSELPISVLVFGAIVVLYLLNSIKILRDYERGVIFRLGRSLPTPKGLESFRYSGLSIDRVFMVHGCRPPRSRFVRTLTDEQARRHPPVGE